MLFTFTKYPILPLSDDETDVPASKGSEPNLSQPSSTSLEIVDTDSENFPQRYAIHKARALVSATDESAMQPFCAEGT